jgi:hypothetical protein
MHETEVGGLPHTKAVLSPTGIGIGLSAKDAVEKVIQGDQKASVHLMITIQKVTSNVQSVACNFWVVPRRVVFNSRRFETLSLFQLHRRVDMK